MENFLVWGYIFTKVDMNHCSKQRYKLLKIFSNRATKTAAIQTDRSIKIKDYGNCVFINVSVQPKLTFFLLKDVFTMTIK